MTTPSPDDIQALVARLRLRTFSRWDHEDKDALKAADALERLDKQRKADAETIAFNGEAADFAITRAEAAEKKLAELERGNANL